MKNMQNDIGSRVVRCRPGDMLVFSGTGQTQDIQIAVTDRNGQDISEKSYLIRITKNNRPQILTR
ncbi:hypothetical protein [Desulfonema magnum]|nr:hypothetical protein [Desulfonema magnum]